MDGHRAGEDAGVLMNTPKSCGGCWGVGGRVRDPRWGSRTRWDGGIWGGRIEGMEEPRGCGSGT